MVHSLFTVLHTYSNIYCSSAIKVPSLANLAHIYLCTYNFQTVLVPYTRYPQL